MKGIDPIPFPVDVLPEVLKDLVENGAKALGCSPEYIVLPALAACAGAIGNARRLQLKTTWTVPVSLWTLVIADSGAGKTPAFDLAMRPLRERQSKATADNHEHGSSPYRFLVGDTTVEALAPLLRDNPKGLLLMRDELSGWFGSFDKYSKGSGDAAQWLSLYDGEPMLVDRKTGDEKTIHVPRPAMSVCGGIQPGILSTNFKKEQIDSGMAARFLFAYPPKIRRRWTDEDVPAEHLEKYARLINSLLDMEMSQDHTGQLVPAIVQPTSDARKLFIDFFNTHNEERENSVGPIASAWAKLEEYAARLALVIHCVLSTESFASNDELSESSMKAGITLTEWFKEEALRVYSLLSNTGNDYETEQLIDVIRRNGGRITERQLCQKSRKFRPTSKAEELLNGLVIRGYGEWVHVEPSPTGGRPTRYFRRQNPENSRDS